MGLTKEEILTDEIIERLKTHPEDFEVYYNDVNKVFYLRSKYEKVKIDEDGLIYKPFIVYISENKRLEELVSLITPIMQPFKDKTEKKEEKKKADKLKDLWD